MISYAETKKNKTLFDALNISEEKENDNWGAKIKQKIIWRNSRLGWSASRLSSY